MAFLESCREPQDTYPRPQEIICPELRFALGLNVLVLFFECIYEASSSQGQQYPEKLRCQTQHSLHIKVRECKVRDKLITDPFLNPVTILPENHHSKTSKKR